jgi:cyanophycinase
MFRDAPSVLDVLKGRFSEGKEIGEGLGFVGSQLFVDQHFLRRGRLGRMLPVMHAKGYTLGLGVEENSAVVVRGTSLDVAGGKAVLADLRGARIDQVQGAFRLRGARLSLLDRQDRFDTATGQLQPAEAKLKQQTLQPGTPAYKPYYSAAPFYVDMLGEGVLATAMGQLIDASYDEVRGISFDPRAPANDPLGTVGFEFRLYKTPDSICWYTDAYGDEDYTVHRIGLDITPLRMAQPLYAPLSA